jgi:DNA-binding transcriptional ArsR family regulator
MERFSHLSEFYKLFSHPIRLGIIHLLGKKELSVQTLSEDLGISDVTLAQHMGRLRRLKVVESRRKGREVFYRLADPATLEACKRFEAVYRKNFK